MKRKVTLAAQQYLHNKKQKHSKLDDIKFKDLKCAEYLLDSRISKNEAKLLFKLRTRMYNVKSNFKNMNNLNLTCDLCKSQICDQPHLLQCRVLQNSVPELKSNISVKYSHIFGDQEKIVPAIKLLTKIIKVREEMLQQTQ